ncbi:dienelactone hydrolase family protein [Nakamurella leprariae]|uniref:Dienelactone hydrolase family protein n=1 Tax=Nakamurella leprariae TaxID=2803911 RepID=A0A938YB54_9ACTN|nr:dienelactone hydrolase family protein [Nakamurella leprariae]MBM9469291.1 dienelactone hydrolase family protein [Nakamurella leprariae]
MDQDTIEPAEQNVSFPRGAGTAYGYLELPAGGSGPGLIVIQEWWGLTTHIAELTKRFAADGFVALAPDLYGGRTTHDGATAMQMMQELPVDTAVQQLSGAVDFLLQHEAVTSSVVGVVGFCMGGAFALRLAAGEGDRIGAAVPFYGIPEPTTDWSGVTAAIQGHYATIDRITPEAVQATAAAIREQSGVEADIRFYEAQHAFVNDERPSYDAAAATTAWAAAVAFLREHVA